MPSLISGSVLRSGGSNQYITLATAQPQLPPTPTTSTGYTVVTDASLVTTYRSSLGNIEFYEGELYSNQPYQNIRIVGTGTSTVIVTGGIANTGTNTGALIVEGGIGISDGLWTGRDIHVNGLTIGQGYEGLNNIVVRGVASPQNDAYPGQAIIAIGYDTLTGLDTSLKSIAIGRYALSSGTGILNSIAIGDSALKKLGTVPGGLAESNIAIGNYSGDELIDGRLNLFLGHDIAPNLTTGSYNFFVGHEVGINMTHGSGNIAIGGDNLRDGVDNQINIGSMLYYDGGGYLQLNADTGLGLGTTASPLTQLNTVSNINTSTVPVVVTSINHGLSSGEDVIITGIQGTTQINNNVYYVKNLTTNTFSLYYDRLLSTPVNGTTFTNYISSGTVYAVQPNGALIVLGGVYITDNLIVDNDTVLNNKLTVAGTGTVRLTPTSSGTVIINPNTVGSIDSMTIGFNKRDDGYFKNLYANTLTVDHFFINSIDGAIDKANNIKGGYRGSIPIQSAPDTTAFIPIGNAGEVLVVVGGTTATWQAIGGLSAGTSTNSENIFINPVVPNSPYYLVLSETISDYGPLDSDSLLAYQTTDRTLTAPNLTITNTATILGSVYSVGTGNPDENYLLYSPKTTVGSSPHANPRIGDYWIDSANKAGYQYINDSSIHFWLQIFTL
jgi:hypothetical protein